LIFINDGTIILYLKKSTKYSLKEQDLDEQSVVVTTWVLEFDKARFGNGYQVL